MNAHDPSPSRRRLRFGGPVQQISLAYIFNLSRSLEEIDRLPDVGTSSEMMFQVWDIEAGLEGLLNQSVFSGHFRSSRGLGVNLLGAVKKVSAEFDFEQPDKKIYPGRLKAIYANYKIALLAEIDSFYSYFVTQKRGYDTLSLIAHADILFPDELHVKVPEAIYDIQEAGRSLAFERFTAAGFHVFRAVESVVRRYWAYKSGGSSAPKVRSLGVYIAAMEKNNIGNSKVVAALRQLNTLHRNPLAHPEVVLTLDETTAILGASQSAISSMLPGLPVIQPTTGHPIMANMT